MGDARPIARAAIADAVHVTSSLRCQTIPQDLDDALMAPWVATGRLSREDARLFDARLFDARLFDAARVADPALSADLAAARAEHVAVQAMAENIRPSLRPLLALFAAIDGEGRFGAANITALNDRRHCRSVNQQATVQPIEARTSLGRR